MRITCVCNISSELMYRKTTLTVVGSILGICVVVIGMYLVQHYRGRVSDGDRTLTKHHAVVTHSSGTNALIERLQLTLLLNGSEIHDQLGLVDPSNSRDQNEFRTISPYEPPYQEAYTHPDPLRYPMPSNSQSYELVGANSMFLLGIIK